MGSTSGSNPGSGANPPAGSTPPALPIALKVSFTLETPDGLRKVSFGLEKDTDGAKVDWTITFVLYERTSKTASFGDPVVSLNVFVAAALHAKAQAAVDNKGLTPAQTAHATGPAADAAKAAQAGTMPAPVANNIIQNTLK
ncbi:MAG TPA: hypothetical protein VGF05_18730 [Bryobacteraceae bacterium]